VRPGTAYRLYDLDQFQGGAMLCHTVPEMVRTPLEELVLQTQLLELGPPNGFLAKALDPPERRAVNAAVRSLLELGALRVKPHARAHARAPPEDGGGSPGGNGPGGPGSGVVAGRPSGQSVELTSLGHHVARLPVAPKLAKLLVLGALFGVPEEALTIAACLSERPAFVGPYDKREEVTATPLPSKFTAPPPPPHYPVHIYLLSP
jgi:HrpA-like RNA helicase